jgi:hypothetical protein
VKPANAALQPIQRPCASHQATGTGSWSATLEPGSNLLAPAQQLSFSAYPGLGIPLDANRIKDLMAEDEA